MTCSSLRFCLAVSGRLGDLFLGAGRWNGMESLSNLEEPGLSLSPRDDLGLRLSKSGLEEPGLKVSGSGESADILRFYPSQGAWILMDIESSDVPFKVHVEEAVRNVDTRRYFYI